MKKSIFISFVLIILSLCGCGRDATLSEEKLSETQIATPSGYLATYLESSWLNTLPYYVWDDVIKSDDSLSYIFKKDEESGVKKQVSYTKMDNGNYSGTMKISFNKSTDSYIANIPKAFASHVDKLNFSIEPSKIINPDPIVEFSSITGELTIISSEIKKAEEVEKNLEEQIIDAESEKCEELSGNEAVACILSLIAKYRDLEYIENEIAALPLNDVLGASAQAVSKKNLDYCKKFMNDKDKQMLCYEYSYQILVRECNAFEDKTYRDCVRSTNQKLPSLYENRLFCGHIDDADMRAECQGTASLETCDDIADEEDRNMCKLNILRTNNVLADCEKIGDDEYEMMCKALIGTDRADASICLAISDDYVKGQCLTKVAMVNSNKDLCSKINDENSRSLCNGYFIIKLEATEEMCANENELWLKEMCQMALAIDNKDTSKCSDPEIVSYDNQYICFTAMAVKHKDADICEKINTTRGDSEDESEIKKTMKDACFEQIAIDTKNPELCERINDKKKKDECTKKLEKKDIPRMTCADVTPTICPKENLAGRGASKHITVDIHDVQCTYYASNRDGYPLYNEVYKVRKNIRDGSFKQYYKSGKIKIYSNHKEGQNEGFRIECSEAGELTQCLYYDSGNPTIDCMP